MPTISEVVPFEQAVAKIRVAAEAVDSDYQNLRIIIET
jgi:hypothetical protein